MSQITDLAPAGKNEGDPPRKIVSRPLAPVATPSGKFDVVDSSSSDCGGFLNLSTPSSSSSVTKSESLGRRRRRRPGAAPHSTRRRRSFAAEGGTATSCSASPQKTSLCQNFQGGAHSFSFSSCGRGRRRPSAHFRSSVLLDVDLVKELRRNNRLRS